MKKYTKFYFLVLLPAQLSYVKERGLKLTEKDLKKLGRRELLELLLIQTQRADEQEKMLADMKKRLLEKNASMTNQSNSAGTEIKPKVSSEIPQAVPNQYIEDVESCSDICDKMLMEAQKRCDKIERQTEEKILKAKNEIESILADFKSSLEE